MLDEKDLKIIEETLKKGDRIELIPCRGYVKIISVRRKEISPQKSNKDPTP